MPETLPPEGYPFTDTASMFSALKWALLRMHDDCFEEYFNQIQTLNEVLSPFQFTAKPQTSEIGIDVRSFGALQDRLLQMKSESREEYSALLEEINKGLFPFFQITLRDGEE
jgi:hypothetical protein